VAVTVIALFPANTQAQQSVNVNLAPQNNSGQSGTAVLTPDGSGTKVVLTLSNAPGPHPAHIHSGSCPDVGAVVYPLTAVSDGKSETTVAASIADILKQPMAINVHKSPQEVPVYTACGNVTANAAAAPAAQPSPAAKPAAQPSPAAKPAAQPAQAPAPAPAAKPAASPAPAQAPRPAASPAPAGLPRTGEADNSPIVWASAIAGLALLGGGVILVRRRRSA
jgi:LPXTG-motif cell wall-anchored protein